MAVTAGAEYPTAVALLRVGLGVENATALQVRRVKLRVFGMDMQDCAIQHAHGGNWIDTLPKQMTRIKIASDIRSSDRPQLQHRLRIVDKKTGMHLNRDFHPVVGHKLRVFD